MKIGRILAALGSLVFVFALHTDPAAAPHYAPWSDPVHLAPPVNSEFIEQAATLSNDGMSLYVTSTRPCGAGDVVADPNIWVAHRSALDAPWGDLECLDINVDGYEDSNPGFSRDGHWMFFVSNRPGGFGAAGTPPGRDLWITWRAHTHDDHAWGEPVNAGPMVNSTAADAGPAYFENDGGLPQLFFTTQRSGMFDLWVADIVGDFQFASAHPIAELNTPDLVEAGPTVRHDGLEIFFFRGLTAFDIFAATRLALADPWSTPVRIDAPVSSEFNEQGPRISKDGQTLLFASNRPGTLGNLDIWMATRTRTTGKP
jgi:WD40 repeat protein